MLHEEGDQCSPSWVPVLDTLADYACLRQSLSLQYLRVDAYGKYSSDKQTQLCKLVSKIANSFLRVGNEKVIREAAKPHALAQFACIANVVFAEI